jgi:hypothetical protein
MAYPYGEANLTDFAYFIYTEMGVPVAALPTDSVDIGIAFEVAKCTVDPFIRRVSPVYYNLAFYNFGGDWLINNVQDQECQTFFADLRKKWNINGFVAGVVSGTADLTTSTSLQVPDNLKDLSLFDLQMLKTPYGRYYMSIAQKFGDLWGIT